jgi:hypothetical protein
MLPIHAIKSAVRSGRHTQPISACATLAIQGAFSDVGRYRIGDLIQCGPALTQDKDLSRYSENDN